VITKLKGLTNTENKKRLVSNFLSLSVLRGFQFLIPLITLPYLVKTIGIENFGLVNFALSLGLYFGAIIQFGFGITATREIARNRDNHQKLEQIYSSTLSASVIIAMVSAVLFTLIVFSFNKFNNYLNLYLFTFAFIVFQSLFPIWFFQGMERMKYITYLTFISNLGFLVGLFVFVKQDGDFYLVPLLQAISSLTIFIAALVLISRDFRVNFSRPKMQEIKTILKEGRHASISQLAPNLYNNSAVFLLGIFTNNSIVGLYTAATKVIDAVISFGYILSNTFLPYLSRDLTRHKFFQAIMLGSGLVLTVATFLFSEWITKFLFSAENLEVSIYIEWLSLTIFFVFMFLTFNTNYLMLIGEDRVAKNISLYVSLAAFLWTIAFIYSLNLVGAVISMLLARLALAVISFYFYKRLMN
jgi:PST family polysaccharide transporter